MDFVSEYHQKKTAALFDFAMRAAALAVGCDTSMQEIWGDVGMRLGLAFQLIDDLLDLYLDEDETGKTTGRDRLLDRPNGALLEGSNETVKRLSKLIDEACCLVREHAKRPQPVLRLMESFDAMLLKVELSNDESPTTSATASGIFSQRVVASEMMDSARAS